MKKYPIISKSGNEYKVELFVGESIALAGFNIVIKERRKGFFGIQYFKKLKHYNELLTEKEMFEEYGSYVDIAKHFVSLYEYEINEVPEFEELRNNYAKEFEEWGGKC